MHLNLWVELQTCHIIILINFLCLPPHWPRTLCSPHPSLLSDSLSPSIFSWSLLLFCSLSPAFSSRHLLGTLHCLPAHGTQSKRNWTLKWSHSLVSASIMGLPSSAAFPVFYNLLFSPAPQVAFLQSFFFPFLLGLLCDFTNNISTEQNSL